MSGDDYNRELISSTKKEKKEKAFKHDDGVWKTRRAEAQLPILFVVICFSFFRATGGGWRPAVEAVLTKNRQLVGRAVR